MNLRCIFLLSIVQFGCGNEQCESYIRNVCMINQELTDETINRVFLEISSDLDIDIFSLFNKKNVTVEFVYSSNLSSYDINSNRLSVYTDDTYTFMTIKAFIHELIHFIEDEKFKMKKGEIKNHSVKNHWLRYMCNSTEGRVFENSAYIYLKCDSNDKFIGYL